MATMEALRIENGGNRSDSNPNIPAMAPVSQGLRRLKRVNRKICDILWFAFNRYKSRGEPKDSAHNLNYELIEESGQWIPRSTTSPAFSKESI
jgi:hypothetical protein